jgi:hypothetical protein
MGLNHANHSHREIIHEGALVRVLPESGNRNGLDDAEGYAHPEHRLSTSATCVVFFPDRDKKDNTFNLPRDILAVVSETLPRREPELISAGPNLQLGLL